MAGVCCFGLTKSDALKDDEYIVQPGEASKNDNGKQSCIVFENTLFLSISKIIFQSVRVVSPMMALTENIAPRPMVIRTGSTLE